MVISLSNIELIKENTIKYGLNILIFCLLFTQNSDYRI